VAKFETYCYFYLFFGGTEVWTRGSACNTGALLLEPHLQCLWTLFLEAIKCQLYIGYRWKLSQVCEAFISVYLVMISLCGLLQKEKEGHSFILNKFAIWLGTLPQLSNLLPWPLCTTKPDSFFSIQLLPYQVHP